MKRLTGMLLAATLLAGFGIARGAQAQTTEQIISKGTINIGVLVDLPPYGSLDANQKPAGFDIDVANLLGKYLGVKVNLVQLTGPNRIPYLMTNKVDLLVGTFGITPERAKTVLFSIPYSAISNVIFAKKSAKISSMDDLKGKTVGVPRAAVQDVLLTNALGTSANIRRFDDDASTYQALLTGQVDAIAETGITGDALFAKHPGADIVEKFTLLDQPNGITMRPNQWNLHQWVDTFVYYIKQDGELGAIYQKWFHKKLPNLPTF